MRELRKLSSLRLPTLSTVAVCFGTALLSGLLLTLSVGRVTAADYTNNATGNYNASIWDPSGNPAGTTADNVVVTNGTVTLNVAYAATNDTINVVNDGVLSLPSSSFRLSGTTLILNSGGTLTMTPATAALMGAVIRLNGGVISNASIGTTTYLMGGEFQVWDSSTITHRQSGGSPIFSYGSLDFVAANKTLTLGSEVAATGAATFRFDSVTITNDATVALARQGGTGVQVQFADVTLNSTRTLFITNTTGNAATMTFLGGNPNMLGTVDIRAGAIVTPGASNAMGSAFVAVNEGGILFLNTIYGLSGNTVSLNQGGLMNLPTVLFTAQPSGYLSNAVVRLNGGTLLYSATGSSGTKVPGGELQVWDDSTMEAAVGAGQVYINDKLDFTVGGKTLTLLKSAGVGGLFTFRMSAAVVTNNGTLVFSTAAGLLMDARFDGLEGSVGSTLTLTNATGAGTGTLTVSGNNSGMLGGLDLRSGVVVNVITSNALGRAAVTINNGGTLNVNVAFGLSSGTTNTINSGGVLTVDTTANTLTGAVVRLNGGTLFYTADHGNVTRTPMAVLQVLDDSTITNLAGNGALSGGWVNQS